MASDELWSFRGNQDHCGWGSANFIWIGRGESGPAGIPESHWDQYARDPRGLFDDLLADDFVDDVDLPADAKYSGYSNDNLRLWIASSVSSAVYVEVGDRFELWPRVEGPDPILCA